jgi:hypothetical protein
MSRPCCAEGLALVQIYANPIYELLDTKFGHFDEGTWSAYNTIVRIITRGCVTSNTAAGGTGSSLTGPCMGHLTHIRGQGGKAFCAAPSAR